MILLMISLMFLVGYYGGWSMAIKESREHYIEYINENCQDEVYRTEPSINYSLIGEMLRINDSNSSRVNNSHNNQ